jgi:pimeloyl-ACP methyl ester carboxylesterase
MGIATGALAGVVASSREEKRLRASARPLAVGDQPMNAAAFAAARRVVETRFGRIAFVERGRGSVALFLHGFPLNGFQWRGAIAGLSAVRRCIAPDFMGLGYTEVAKGQSLAPAEQVEMIVTVLDELSVTTVDLIANDSGGAVAQLLVTRYPHRFRTLLLTNCDTEHDSPPPALLPAIEASRKGTFVDETLAPQLADTSFARSAQGIGRLCYVDPAHPTDEAIEYYFQPLVSTPARKALVHAYALALERNPLEGIGPALKQCRIPTRTLWGTGDTIFSLKSPDYLDQAFGESRGVRRLEGRKLFWPEELPEVIVDEARRLWRSN